LEAAIQSLIVGCTALEGLELQGIHGFITLCIVSSSIRTIGVSGLLKHKSLTIFQELVIQDAPFLERLIIVGLAVLSRIRVTEPPKLTILGHVSNERPVLVIGDIIIEVSSIFLHLCLRIILFFILKPMFLLFLFIHLYCCPPEDDPRQLDMVSAHNQDLGSKFYWP
jgi:hypothetical protein